MDDNIHNGIPPPGWTVPPQKYKSFILALKFEWRKNAENFEFDDEPYKEPWKEPVFNSISFGPLKFSTMTGKSWFLLIKLKFINFPSRL